MSVGRVNRVRANSDTNSVAKPDADGYADEYADAFADSDSKADKYADGYEYVDAVANADYAGQFRRATAANAAVSAAERLG